MRGTGHSTHEAIALANQHPRVDIQPLGSALAALAYRIDPWFLVDAFPIRRSDQAAGIERLYARPDRRENPPFGCGHLEPKIICLGATYKP